MLQQRMERRIVTTPTPLQDSLPALTCYGCGPANPDGLHLKSRWSDDGQFVVATFEPHPRYNAGMPNVMYGGTIASLIDCHALWAVIATAYRDENRPIGSPPDIVYVTGQMTIKYLSPTPLDRPIHLKAWITEMVNARARVACELGPAGQITATGDVIAIRLSDDQLAGLLPGS